MDKNNKTWYTGIADNEGIESFLPLDSVDSEQKAMFTIRAHANPHRFAVVYKAELDDETADNVMTHLENHNYVNALKAMGNGIKNNNLEAESTNKKYWNLITKHSATLNKILKEQE
jgi:diphthamide synthase (EF-2-diphthine--ammonia ligase)